MRGRGFGGGGPMGPGPGPNGFGPPMRGRGFGSQGPRGPPQGGWEGPPFRGGPGRGMGGPPRGMMHGRGDGPPWGGPPNQGGWNEDEEDFDEMMEMGRPEMRHHGGPPGEMGGPHGEMGGQPGDMGGPGPENSNPLGIDLSGEVWVETKTEEGKSYFYNARTRVTTWSRPEETPGVRILSQNQVEELTQQLAGNENKGRGPEDGPQFGGTPPASYMPPPGNLRAFADILTPVFINRASRAETVGI